MSDSDSAKRLTEVLLENNLLSQAQIELALVDQEITGIPLEEVLIVRGWITSEKLYDIAPWLQPDVIQQANEAVKMSTAKPHEAVPRSVSASQSSKTGSAPDLTSAGTVTGESKPQADSKPTGFQDSRPATPESRSARQAEPARAAAKPEGIPKEPPKYSFSTNQFMTPVKSDREKNLKAYKEILRKILATGKEA